MRTDKNVDQLDNYALTFHSALMQRKTALYSTTSMFTMNDDLDLLLRTRTNCSALLFLEKGQPQPNPIRNHQPSAPTSTHVNDILETCVYTQTAPR